jgi:predicted acetyltransferase
MSERRTVKEAGAGVVTLEAATRAQRPILENLLELYVHDLSEAFDIEVGRDGRFGYDRLPLYWQEPERRFPFLIRDGSAWAGLALVTRGSPVTDDSSDLDVAEFFVLRRHRRSGVGRRAAFLLFDRIPGRWIVRVADRNHRGLPFWNEVVPAYTRGEFSRPKIAAEAQGWTVFTFHTRPAARP